MLRSRRCSSAPSPSFFPSRCSSLTIPLVLFLFLTVNQRHRRSSSPPPSLPPAPPRFRLDPDGGMLRCPFSAFPASSSRQPPTSSAAARCSRTNVVPTCLHPSNHRQVPLLDPPSPAPPSCASPVRWHPLLRPCASSPASPPPCSVPAVSRRRPPLKPGVAMAASPLDLAAPP